MVKFTMRIPTLWAVLSEFYLPFLVGFPSARSTDIEAIQVMPDSTQTDGDTRLVDLVAYWLVTEQNLRSAELANARARAAIEEWQLRHTDDAA